MATIPELDRKPGDRVISITAHRTLPSGGLEVGIPLDKPGAIINASCLEIVALNVPSSHSGYPVNSMRLIWTTDSAAQGRVGSVREDIPTHMNYVEEGDPRLYEELKRAGVRLKITMGSQDFTSYEIVKTQNENI